MRLLGQRQHSELELRQKLRRRGCPADEVDAALARLRELRYLDDDAYARSLVARRAGSRGPALIAAELAARGIDQEAARRALDDLSRQELLDAACRLVARWDGAERRVLAGRLRQRGFPSDVIREALG